MNGIVRRSELFLFLILFFVGNQTLAQRDMLSLEQCQKEVQENYPLGKGMELIKLSSNLNVDNLRVSYLPKLYANGKASYQSDVTGISLPGMNTPTAPKDQYSLNLDVEQLIYDGGKTQNRIDIEKKTSEVEMKNLEIQMYQLRERVNAAYFGIQLVRKNKLILADKQKTILERMGQIESAVKNGVVLPANLKVLQSELLLIDQQMQELYSHELMLFAVLSKLMGRHIGIDIELENTKFSDEVQIELEEKKRPEYQFYSSQKSLLESQNEMVKKDRYPVVAGFGQFGYGNPGYNQLNDKFDTYYMIGAKVSWNVFDWKANRRKQKEIAIQKDIITTNELSFTQNQLIELESELSKVNMFKVLLQKDDAIVDLQEEVSKSSASQLDNGVITSSDYLEDLNKEIQAKLNREYHLIQLQQSLAEYRRIKGI